MLKFLLQYYYDVYLRYLRNPINQMFIQVLWKCYDIFMSYYKYQEGFEPKLCHCNGHISLYPFNLINIIFYMRNHDFRTILYNLIFFQMIIVILTTNSGY